MITTNPHTERHRSGSDQARELRALIAQKHNLRETAPSRVWSCRSIAVVSGKGGVGKTVIALKLAVALARQGDRVCLLDATAGAGELGLLCGQAGYWNLAHVAAGLRTVSEIRQTGPYGVTLVSGAGVLSEACDSRGSINAELERLEHEHDWLIVDTSSGSEANWFGSEADRVVMVTTPEPTALASTYAALKQLAVSSAPVLSVLVNQVASPEQAEDCLSRLEQTARSFLHTEIHRAGFIPCDRQVAESVSLRNPLHGEDEASPGSASDHIRRLAESFRSSIEPGPNRSYFQCLLSPKRRCR